MKKYTSGRHRKHRKDIQRNENQGKGRKELYRVVLDREGGNIGLPSESSAVHTVNSRYRSIPKAKAGRRNYNWESKSIHAGIRR